jgi:cysteinyl-tRNA synthetase
MKNAFFFVFLALIVSSCFKEKRSDAAAEKMQDFVVNISEYARGIDPDFIIIPQNGVELAYNNLEPSEGFNPSYMNAIDGLGVEELFYNGNYAEDRERLPLLQELKVSKKILVSEYVKDDADISDAILRNRNEGFLSFIRKSSNYDYLQIPGIIESENTEDINSLSDVQNFLYLISTDNFPAKQDMLDAIAATNYDLVLIDLFFDEVQLSKSEVSLLKIKANGGKRLVIAYMNVGSAEKYRYYWGKSWGLHHPLWIKRKYEGYDDEFWLKFWNDEWQKIIYGNDNSYTKKILDSGFDGAYLDNVEAYYFVYFRN